MRWEAAAEGGDVGGGEEEAAVHHVVVVVVRLRIVSFRTSVVAVLVVRARHARWVTSAEEVSFPNRLDRGPCVSAGEFAHRGHELGQPGRVAHCMIQAGG